MQATHLAILVQTLKDRAVSLSHETDIESPQLSHELLHIEGCDSLEEVDIFCK